MPARVSFAPTLARAAIIIAVVLAPMALDASPAAAVAHGIAVPTGQYPFAVRLSMTHIPRPDGTSYNSACSAALISPTWIITAGHCFHDVNRSPISGPVPYPTTATLNAVLDQRGARPGRSFDVVDLLSPAPGENRTVTDVQQAGTTDIALARLSAPVNDVTPIALSDTAPAAGTVLTIAGWGATSSIIPTPSTRLSVGEVTIRTVTPTAVTVAGRFPAADTSACLYDSGAPYFTTPVGAPPRLVAIESTGPDCPHASVETTARVDTITAWMTAIVPDLP